MAIPSLHDYFAAHNALHTDYMAVFIARPIDAGEKYEHKSGYDGVPTMSTPHTARTNGYLLYTDDYVRAFATHENLEEFAVDMSFAKAALPPRDLPDDVQVTFTARNDAVAIGPHNDLSDGKAKYDGFVVSDKEGQRFYPTYNFTALFNFAVAKKPTHEELIISFRDDSVLKGFIIPTTTTVDEDGFTRTLNAGDVVVQDTSEPDRYMVIPADLARLTLREKPTSFQPPRFGI